MLKVLHVPYTYAPDPVGGTEIYVKALAKELQCFGIESVIAAPSASEIDQVYDYDGISVYRYSVSKQSKNMLRELYGAGDPGASKKFALILDKLRPDIVHMHALTRAVSILLVEAVKQRGIPVIFTYHTPTVSCHRGTLMLWGDQECDGVLDVQRCTACSLNADGLPRWLSKIVSLLPSSLTIIIERMKLSGGIWTVVRRRELMRLRQEAFTALMYQVDAIVALREWVRRLLTRNGVPDWKIVLSPHGLLDAPESDSAIIDVAESPLRVAFLGRADKVKGIDTLIKAVRAMPDLSIELDLYGVTQSIADEGYQALLKSLAADDPRISFRPSVLHEQVVALLKKYHVLAVPSRWMETGPLVVLESFLAGTPVIGSNLGGIAEWVQHEKNGLLVDFDDVAGWGLALKRCAEDRHLLASLREGIERPRSMTVVAHEMAGIYTRYADAGRLLHSQPQSQANEG
jgi:glycosyltransferase involved in cell wall biosynthesis